VSNLSPADIQALLDSGRIVEAGSLLTMHGETLPPEERQALEHKRQQLWAQATALVAEAEVLEQEGKNVEAQERYLQAAEIASDFPGIQEHCKRMREALSLASAVRLRSKRIRAQAELTSPTGTGKKAASLLVAFLLFGLGGGTWWYLEKMASQPQTHSLEARVSKPPAVAGISTPAPPGKEEMPVTKIQPSPPSTEPETPAVVVPDRPIAHNETTMAPVQAAQEPAMVASEKQHSTQPEPVVDQPTHYSRPEDRPEPAVSPPASQMPAATSAPLLSEQTPPDEAPLSAPPVTQDQATETLYTVQPGDTLSEIASRLFCNQGAWHQIHALNRDLVKNPDLLRPGRQIRIDGIESRCRPRP